MKIIRETVIGFVCVLFFTESITSSINFWKVILDQTDLYYDSIFRVTYPRPMSLSQCGSLALQNTSTSIALFCQTPEGQCLLSNASYPAHYDDGSGGGGYKCYTTIPPLVDRDTGRTTCNTSVPLCPPPFRVVGGGAGCIFVNWSLRNFHQARFACRALLPCADLYQGPESFELTAFLALKLVLDPWVGARKRASDGAWEWIGNQLVLSSSWSIVLLEQPDHVGFELLLPIPFTLSNGTTTDCAILWTTNILQNKLADNYCAERHHYICQIPQRVMSSTGAWPFVGVPPFIICT